MPAAHEHGCLVVFQEQGGRGVGVASTERTRAEAQMIWLNILKRDCSFLGTKKRFELNEQENQNSEGLSIMSDDEDDETVDDALKTATSLCHIYLVFRLHSHNVISVPEIHK